MSRGHRFLLIVGLLEGFVHYRRGGGGLFCYSATSHLQRSPDTTDTSIPAPALSVQQLQGTAELLSVRLQPLAVGQLGDLAPTLQAAAAERADPVLLAPAHTLL